MKKIDLHVHTRLYSDCAFIKPEDVIERALAEGLDGLALTEHGMRWPDREFDRLRLRAESRGLLLINGQEIYTTDRHGHMEGEFLVFGVRRSLVKAYQAKELIDIVHAEGGVIVAAHPYKLSRNGKMHYYGAGDRLEYLEVDAVELYHPDQNERARSKVQKIMTKRGLPGTGGSDAHVAFAIGECYTIFEADIDSEAKLIAEIKAGRIKGACRVPVEKK